MSVLLILASCRTSDKDLPLETSRLQAPAASELMLDVNDVSLLLPTQKGQVGGALAIPIHPKLDPTQFLTAQLLREAAEAGRSPETVRVSGSPIASELPEVQDLKNWRVVGFRFDPCAPSTALAHGSLVQTRSGVQRDCGVEIRLILQPLARYGGAAGLSQPPFFADMSLHVIFELGDVPASRSASELPQAFAKFRPMIESLQRIKALSIAAGASTDGRPLGVHPGLQYEMNRGQTAIGLEVSRFLKTFAKREDLKRITFMGTDDHTSSPIKWIFIGGQVKTDSRGVQTFVQSPLDAFHKKSVMAVVKERTDMNPTSEGIHPTPEDTARSVAPFVSLDVLKNGKAITEAQKAAVFESDHPSRSHIHNVDCVSCHLAGVVMRGEDILAGTIPQRFVSPPGISGYLAAGIDKISDYQDGLNFRAFGYFGVNASISSRTVNESAGVTQLMNQIIAGEKARNPGLNCGTQQAVLDQVWDCSLNHAYGQDCFKGCTINGQ